MIAIFTAIMKAFFNHILILMFAFAAIMAIVNSCSNIMPCNTQRVRNVEFSFVHFKNKMYADTSVARTRILGLHALNDSLLYDTTIQKGGLPLSMILDSTVYLLGIDSINASTDSATRAKKPIIPIIYDTITFHVKKVLSMETPECGFNYTFEITHGSYTQNLIDSIIILNKNVSAIVDLNLKLVFRNAKPYFRKLPLKYFK
jgi:hypothetical protein